ncbi:MAG: universal stress protein [Alphaproteobacteria bacterium]|mgnify:CR=1 FL=1|nr:universal stress protein [Alphaproteobacteria bacterium]MDX5367842.1 universal stress protein [Alphaproteobacteria bacterium]MDX5462715.1 universal stress protein [Alphaproteobacteria bacterium]
MYRRIMVPVDLTHVERLDKALNTAADLAKHYGIPMCLVGVTAAAASPVAHTPAEYASKLAAFGTDQSKQRGIEIETKAYTSHDPAIDLDKTLMGAIEELDADLVVMASHIPGVPDHIFASNAGYLAAHAGCSVFVIR